MNCVCGVWMSALYELMLRLDSLTAEVESGEGGGGGLTSGSADADEEFKGPE